jgi:hypothetical protein
MESEATELIRYLSNFSVLIPLLFYLIKFKILPRENHVIGLFVIVSGVADLIGFLYSSMKISNAHIFNIHDIVAFAMLCYYYHQVVFQFKNREYFYFGIGVYVISLLIVTSRVGFFDLQGELWAISGFVLVVFGIIYNNYQVEKPPLLDKNLYSGLIFNAAIMFYFSFNFFLFLIANYVLTELSPETSRMTWAFHNVNNIIKDLAFAAGLYYTNRRRLNLTDEEVERIQWHHLQS